MHGTGVFRQLRLHGYATCALEFEIVRERDNAIEEAILNWHGPNWDTRNVITELIVMFVYTIAHGKE